MKMHFLSAVVLLAASGLTPVRAGKCPKGCRCDDSKLTVACIGKNLTEVPPTINEITVKLDLKNNNLQILPRGAFLITPYLTHLNLQRCSITKVKEGAFRTLGRLVSLNLAHNKIDVLYQESFDGLASLKELHLEHNLVEELQPGAFTQLGFLNMLALDHNQLVYIPNMAFQVLNRHTVTQTEQDDHRLTCYNLFKGLNNIMSLDLSYNSINNLAPEAFAGLFTLTELSLDHNELQFFPTLAMSRLRDVSRLDVSHNPMIYLGEESISMSKLTHLYLNHMSLQDLSEQALSHAPLLSYLDLSHNQLRYLEPLSGPTELASLNLTANPIYCSCFMRPLKDWASVRGVKLLGACAGPPHLSDEPLNEVASSALRCRSRGEMMKEEFEEEEETARSAPPTTVPKQKVKCPVNCDCDVEAQHATCEGRGHTKLPKGFPSKTQLLDLRSNHFHYLPSNSFPGTSQVVSLHLEFCKIHEVEGAAFQGMKNLLYLYLSDNDLTFLDPKAFAGVPKLTYLHLEGNRLAQFPGPALGHLPSLFVLHLERNNISKLEPTGLLSSVTPNLKELYLTNNSIRALASGALDSPFLGKLHLDSNQLTKVPSEALSNNPNLEELNLSRNLIRWVGPNAFQSVSQSLKRLYVDQAGIEKMSRDALVGLGLGLKALTVRGNQLEELPDLRPLRKLEVVDLQDNPLQCDCALLPLVRWMESVSLEVVATCGHPPEFRGQKVREVHVFKSCPEPSPLPAATRLKVEKPKPRLLKAPGAKAGAKKVKKKPLKATKPLSHRKPVATVTAKNKKLFKQKG